VEGRLQRNKKGNRVEGTLLRHLGNVYLCDIQLASHQMLQPNHSRWSLHDEIIHSEHRKLPKCEESPVGLSVNKVRAGVLFWNGWRRLDKIAGVAVLKLGGRKTGRPDAARALRAAGETPRTGCGNEAENRSKSAVFCRLPTDTYLMEENDQ
jgi:hypothetical protein